MTIGHDALRRGVRRHLHRPSELRRVRAALRSGLSVRQWRLRVSFERLCLRGGLRGHAERSRELWCLRDALSAGPRMQCRRVHVAMLRPERPLRGFLRQPDGRPSQVRVLWGLGPDRHILHRRLLRLRRSGVGVGIDLRGHDERPRQLRRVRQSVRHGKLLPGERMRLFAFTDRLRRCVRRHPDGQRELRRMRRVLYGCVPRWQVRCALKSLRPVGKPCRAKVARPFRA